ncbi:unnamed protein product [Effrenium voratum]|nr:unnamed protein product [Effrenium voratum]
MEESRRATRRLRHGSDLQKSWRLLQDLGSHDLRLNAFHFGAFCGAAQRKAAWRGASAALDLLGSRALLADLITGNAALACLERARLWRKALQALRMAQELDSISCNSSISACARGDAWPQCLVLLLAMPTLRFAADVFSYSPALACCKWQMSGNFLEELHLGRAALDPHSATSALSAAGAPPDASADSWRWALQLLERMAEHGLQQNEVSCGAAVGACRWTSEAWASALRLSSAVPSLVATSSVITAGERVGLWPLSLHLACAAGSRRLALDGAMRTAALSGCARTGRWQRSLLLAAQDSPDSDAGIVMWNAALGACEVRHRWRQGLALLEALGAKSLQTDDVTLGTTAGACSKRGQWREALLLSARMVRLDLPAFNALLAAFSRAAAAKSAAALAQRMAPRLAPDEASFESLLLSYEALGQANMARATVAKAVNSRPAAVHREFLASLRRDRFG